ncbi:hypothetical protein [Spiroplasma endosymbiont of Aspidapion aeneum]|uniref:hypothetical protein n=1 Tax=Spiroplasma endosymbiont of Aspidapion aeneum TaxID=3066276 RepID=UPI00313AC3BD
MKKMLSFILGISLFSVITKPISCSFGNTDVPKIKTELTNDDWDKLYKISKTLKFEINSQWLVTNTISDDKNCKVRNFYSMNVFPQINGIDNQTIYLFEKLEVWITFFHKNDDVESHNKNNHEWVLYGSGSAKTSGGANWEDYIADGDILKRGATLKDFNEKYNTYIFIGNSNWINGTDNDQKSNQFNYIPATLTNWL